LNPDIRKPPVLAGPERQLRRDWQSHDVSYGIDVAVIRFIPPNPDVISRRWASRKDRAAA